MPVRLYVGNLPKELERKELQDVFAEEGDNVSAKVITDRKTGKCRGFAFVTVQTDEIADQIVEKYNGFMFKENPLKIEKALPRKKSKNEKGEKVEGSPSGEESPRPTPKSSGGGKKKKSGRGTGSAATSSSGGGSGSGDSVQPDPRWADQLEKLKEMLSAQTTN